MQSLLESFRVRALNTNPSVVLLEGVNFLNLLELLLKRIFNSKIKTTPVAIDARLKRAKVTTISLLEHLSEREEEHRDLETCDSCLEADFLTGILKCHILVLVLVISVVKFGNDSEDPEGLSVKLLFKISLENVHHAEITADH